MPQPLSSVAPDANVTIGGSQDSPSLHRPALALAAMNVVAEWSLLENAILYLFTRLLGENPTQGAAIFTSIRNQNGKRDAFRAVIPAGCGGDQQKEDLVNAAIAIFEKASKTRNKIAHWVWGYSDDLPDAVLLAKPV